MRPGPFPDPLTMLRHEGMEASVAWAPTISANSFDTKQVTVTGARLGDFVLSSFSLDVDDLSLTADVTEDDLVVAIMTDSSGGAKNPGSGELYIRVIQK